MPMVMIPAGALSDSEAYKYWDEMREEWVKHVQAKRKALEP